MYLEPLSAPFSNLCDSVPTTDSTFRPPARRPPRLASAHDIPPLKSNVLHNTFFPAPPPPKRPRATTIPKPKPIPKPVKSMTPIKDIPEMGRLADEPDLVEGADLVRRRLEVSALRQLGLPGLLRLFVVCREQCPLL